MNTNIKIGIVVVIIAGLFIWGKMAQKDEMVMYKDTAVACLPNGHQNVAEHIHPELTILVDGEEEVIPADIGISSTCMPELHTHDETGKIHAESAIPGRLAQFDLSHFFSVWGTEHDREGYDLEITQDGEVKSSIYDVKMVDLSEIVMKYTSQNSEE